MTSWIKLSPAVMSHICDYTCQLLSGKNHVNRLVLVFHKNSYVCSKNWDLGRLYSSSCPSSRCDLSLSTQTTIVHRLPPPPQT